MSRRRLTHAAKGSPEAYAWAERMRLLREKRAKQIRSLGKRREREFFGAERNPGRPHGTFKRCVKSVRKSLKKYDRKGSAESICGSSMSKKYRKNPIAIFGNPPHGVNARVAGILYNEVIEVRARKTGYKRGFYKHPFETEVMLLALDNGDLLIHSKDGHKLWERD